MSTLDFMRLPPVWRTVLLKQDYQLGDTRLSFHEKVKFRRMSRLIDENHPAPYIVGESLDRLSNKGSGENQK